jgi:hypothetical protein
MSADARSVGVDLVGLKDSGVQLSDLISDMRGVGSLPSGKKDRSFLGSLLFSGKVARDLAAMGWNFSIYDRGEKILSAGSGVSRLTGHVSVNPLKLKKLLSTLFS